MDITVGRDRQLLREREREGLRERERGRRDIYIYIYIYEKREKSRIENNFFIAFMYGPFQIWE